MLSTDLSTNNDHNTLRQDSSTNLNMYQVKTLSEGRPNDLSDNRNPCCNMLGYQLRLGYFLVRVLMVWAAQLRFPRRRALWGAV